MAVAQNYRARSTQVLVFGSTDQGAMLVHFLSHSQIIPAYCILKRQPTSINGLAHSEQKKLTDSWPQVHHSMFDHISPNGYLAKTQSAIMIPWQLPKTALGCAGTFNIFQASTPDSPPSGELITMMLERCYDSKVQTTINNLAM